MTNKDYIFISYSSENVEFANHLRSLLHENGFNVWMDESGLSVGQQWWLAIEEHIQGCSALLVIMSDEAKVSHWVERELLFAESGENNKPIFPILYSGDVWSRLANLQYADMRGGLKASLPSNLVEGLRSVGVIPETDFANITENLGNQAEKRNVAAVETHPSPPEGQESDSSIIHFVVNRTIVPFSNNRRNLLKVIIDDGKAQRSVELRRDSQISLSPGSYVLRAVTTRFHAADGMVTMWGDYVPTSYEGKDDVSEPIDVNIEPKKQYTFKCDDKPSIKLLSVRNQP